MEVKGIAGGVTVIDDFGHHPTAIRETMRALRIKYAKEKIWAVFEPRTNTTRRNYFQDELAASFVDADGVVVSQIARLELLAPEERLNPEKLMKDIGATGKPTAYLPDADAIVAHLAKSCRAVMSSWFSATAASAASTENCWRVWVGDKKSAPPETSEPCLEFLTNHGLNVTLPEWVPVWPCASSFQPEFYGIISNTQGKLSAILTPEQQKLFENYRAEHREIFQSK